MNITGISLNDNFVYFFWCEACKFRNAVILGRDTDLSDAVKSFILCLSKFLGVSGAFPRIDRFFDEKLVCAERDNIWLVIDI